MFNVYHGVNKLQDIDFYYTCHVNRLGGGDAAHENVSCVMAMLIEAIIKYHSICMKHNAHQYGSRFCLLASGLISVAYHIHSNIKKGIRLSFTAHWDYP
jgi:hypothetical protein